MDKKLVVSSALSQDKFIEFLDGYDKDGITLKFVEKKGIKLYFEFTGLEPGYPAQDKVKHLLRNETDWARSVYFAVSFE